MVDKCGRQFQKRMQRVKLKFGKKEGSDARAHPFSMRVGTDYGWQIYIAPQGGRLSCISTASSTRVCRVAVSSIVCFLLS